MKDDGRAQLVLGEATAALRGGGGVPGRDAGLRSGATVVAGDDPTPSNGPRSADDARPRRAGRVARIAEAVAEVVGAQAIYRTSPFERRRRDLATVAAHVLGQRKTLNARGAAADGRRAPRPRSRDDGGPARRRPTSNRSGGGCSTPAPRRRGRGGRHASSMLFRLAGDVGNRPDGDAHEPA